MFDFDEIESSFKDNYFSLSEEEIMEIYRLEGVTLNNYYKELDEYRKNIHLNISAEERLLRSIYGRDDLQKEVEELKEKYEYPTKKRLSLESQKKVVEGCLDLVFDSTKYWYDYLKKEISQERLFYVCLDALINSVKYSLHYEKPVFKSYIIANIDRNIIKYVAKLEHLTYREVYKAIYNIEEYDYKTFEHIPNKELKFKYDDKEIVEKPSKIYYRLKNESYDFEDIKNISSDEFYPIYKEALEELDDTAKDVMKLSYDINGNNILTYAEIGECLCIDKKKVVNAKRRAIRKLRKNEKIKQFIS